MTSPVMARILEAAEGLKQLRIARKECVSCGRSLAHRTDYVAGEDCQRCDLDMPMPPMDDMDEEDMYGNEAGTTEPLAPTCNKPNCLRRPGTDVCLACAVEDEMDMALVIGRVRAA